MKLRETLIKIQAELDAPKNQHNSFGNYNYRSCEDILAAVKPFLGDCILLLNDEVVNVGAHNYVKATATLSDTENTVEVSAYAREALDRKGMDDSQITGSASSYARKYALNGLFAIDDVKDADTTDNRKPATKPVRTVNHDLKAAAEQANAKIASDLSGIKASDVDEVLGNDEPLPWETTPPCETCGQPTTHKTGTSKTGKDWEALFCASGDRDHAKWL